MVRMHPVAEQLQRTFRWIADQGGDLPSVAPLQTQLSPWALWLLLALVRQVERQRWVSSILVTKFGLDLDAISAGGVFGHPSGPQSGLVPDFPEWEYFFHGRGCCFSNRITGESIDVDFYDGISDWIDDFFFVRYLESLKTPEPIERRLIELYPSIETVVLGFGELWDDGLLEKHPDSKVVKPLNDFQELADDIDQLNAVLDSGKRSNLGQLLGDWLLADVNNPASKRSASCLAERQRDLESQFATERLENLALIALCDLVPDPSPYLIQAFKKEPSGTTSAALEIVSKRWHEDWSEPVYELWSRTDPSGDIPHPYVWTTCAAYLLRRGSHVNDIRARFLNVKRRSLGDAAILGLEYFPDLAVPLFRRALRSDVPIDRITAAAALAVLDKPWARTLLLEVLRESTDQQATSECRAALAALPHPQLHDTVARWERANPHEPESRPDILVTEMFLRDRDSRIQHEMESLHDRVIKLRSVNVPAPELRPARRRWWPF